MTNIIVIVLTLTSVLFITSLFTSSRNNNYNAVDNADFSESISGVGSAGLSRQQPIAEANKLPRLQSRPDQRSFNGNISSQVESKDNYGGAINENQIDDPEKARASSAATYREGVLGNYELYIDTSLDRPGDNGSKFDVEKVHGVDLARVEALKREYGINMIASDYIPMDRNVPDIRHPECKYWHYPDHLPTTSVVIVFHNEGLTTLMRTVHSVLLRSPRKLIKEVVLIDDCSDKHNLKEDLENYIKEHFGDFIGSDLPNYPGDKGNLGETLTEKSGKVKLVRNIERQGLIRSRTRGAEVSTGGVVVFLDAHCEVNQNWLPPLLAPIANNRKALTVPLIDGIDSVNFEYRPVYSKNDEHFRGIWEWGMLYKEIGLDMKEHLRTHRVSEPYDSPTHAGGLFAIDRQFFAELGYYDPGLLVWGGENFELSFKVWQCGGKLQWVPCSRVGHIYRPFMPYSFGTMANKRKGPLVLTNYKRVIEVWFDEEYKEYLYTREPLARFYDPGDVTKQLELKKNLGCKSFDWFMNNVAKDVFRDFPKLPANLEWGEVRLQNTKKCLDTQGPQPPQRVIVSDCHSYGGNQLFRLNAAGQLGVGERCVDASPTKMYLTYCKLGQVEGPWRLQGNFLVHKQRNMCLTYDQRVYLDKCNFDTKPDNQQWIWKKIRPNVYGE